MLLEKKKKQTKVWVHKTTVDGVLERLVPRVELYDYYAEGWLLGRSSENTRFGRPDDPDVFIPGNQSGKVWIYRDGKSRMIPKEDFPKFGSKGWVLGRKGR